MLFLQILPYDLLFNIDKKVRLIPCLRAECGTTDETRTFVNYSGIETGVTESW